MMMAMSKMDDRPEIDGLRAVAVLAVVALHLGVKGVSGGFLGAAYLATLCLAVQIITHPRK